jgi:glycosyltransferase involved in cell wall biosynthesis
VAKSKIRLAIIASHPIQYYVPLYQRLAGRDDLAIKVFFTWHAGGAVVEDRGFRLSFDWDIPLVEGYEFELVPNTSSDPGTHHFFGLKNPSLIHRINAWRPDIVHITGWAWLSHVLAMRTFWKRGTPTLFRGDSHLLDTMPSGPSGPRWWIKRAILRRVFSWPSAFLVVGAANRSYYEAFGVDPSRLLACTHSIDVTRFAQPADRHEQEAKQWRQQLGIPATKIVLLFAGKFETKKQPIELMRAVKKLSDPKHYLIMVGSGELEEQVKALAAADPARFCVLPFQNQSRMPVVYRLGDLFVLPSVFRETWGIAVNEALACSRPALVSDRVGCATDIIDESCGRVFSWATPSSLLTALNELTKDRSKLVEMGRCASKRAWSFDIARTEAALMASISHTSVP